LKSILKAACAVMKGFRKAANSHATCMDFPKAVANSIKKSLKQLSMSVAFGNPFM
jgi:hypothetical protein